MGSIVHRSVPTNLKRLPNCSHAHAFQVRFKDVQVGSRWFSTLYILSPNFHTPLFPPSPLVVPMWRSGPVIRHCPLSGYLVVFATAQLSYLLTIKNACFTFLGSNQFV